VVLPAVAAPSQPSPSPQHSTPATKPAPKPEPTYRAKAFDCSGIRDEARAFLGSGLSMEQEGLVFAEAGAQAVAAGAGSGKSTTLVKRLLLMRHRLGVPLSEISVFTFTRNSRRDFIEKLLETAEACQVRLEPAQAQDRVRTFHSKLLQLVWPVLPEGTQIFEFLGKAAKPKPGTPQEADFLRQLEELANERDNPFDSKMSADQAKLLREAYDEAHHTDEAFRYAMRVLLQHAYRDHGRPNHRVDEDWLKRSVAVSRDHELTGWVDAHWRAGGRWPIEGVEPPPRKLAAGDCAFEASGYLPLSNLFVVLGGWHLTKDEVRGKEKKFKPYWACGSKRNILLRACPEAIFFVQTAKDLDRLRELAKTESALRAGRSPIFECRLPGEGGGPKPIVDALYELGVFMENIGLRPAQAHAAVQDRLTGAVERQTLYATSTLFRYFEAAKYDSGVQTFNDLFSLLKKGSPALKRVPLATLQSMKHLLIDEFQDISPLIVSMIEGVHDELIRRRDGQERPTLLVVGDDWQSIYGWRGSAPRFFLEFSHLFSGANPKPVMLEDNYRSTQNIVSCAAQVLRPVSEKYKMPKNCRAANKRFKDLPIPVYAVNDMEEEVVERVLRAVDRLRAPEEEILVVARTGTQVDMAKGIAKRLKLRDTDVMTVHGSKGLEAEYVLVLDDFSYDKEHHVKNALYKHAGFSQTFDESQRDEAMRVAYVALTRGKKLCLWMGKPAERGGAMVTLPEQRPYFRRVDVSLLLDELATLGEVYTQQPVEAPVTP
jgi:superfamily I DNA/RNA helicase